MNKLKKLLIGLAIMVFVAVISFIGALYWMKSHSAEEEALKTKQEEKVKTAVHTVADPIMVNLKDSKKMLRVKVEFEIKNVEKEDTEFLTEIQENDGLITTTIYTVLRSKTYEEVNVPDSLITIGNEITQALNKAYKTDRFIATNYNEFITQ